ncbi:MAG TPA: hypothetical protein VFW68_13455 [Rhodocyclaceae bacterium]|nr:hypothetical protein [Rhodocyclaceae bacterium]
MPRALRPNVPCLTAMACIELSTMQLNALRQLFERRDFSPEDVAQLDYRRVERLPKVGKKGIEAIRSWLCQYGYDLHNVPEQGGDLADQRLRARLDHAERLLKKHGYRVEPPAGAYPSPLTPALSHKGRGSPT